MSKSLPKAPDGLPWPHPRIAVDTSEQLPFAFGYVPARWTEGAPVHHGEVAPASRSLVNELLGGPWECERRNLFTGDYQLISPLDGGLIPEAEGIVIERKGRDLIGSLSADRKRFIEDECPRLAKFRFPAIVAESPIEALIGSRSGMVLALESARATFRWLLDGWRAPETPEEAEEIQAVHDAELQAYQFLGAVDDERRRSTVSAVSLLGNLLSIIVDHRIPVLPLPSRPWAEYAAAWMLRRSWRRWLIEHPNGLAATRRPWPNVVDPRDIDESLRVDPAP